jgi:hypothetical protein
MAKAAAVAKSALPTHGLLQGVKIMFPLTPPKQLTFLISVVLAVAAVVVRYLVYTGVQLPAIIPRWGVLAATNRLSSARCR